MRLRVDQPLAPWKGRGWPGHADPVLMVRSPARAWASRARLPHRVAIVPRIHPGQGSLRAIGGTVLVGGSKDETENGWARRRQDLNFLASPRA
jgi:hypothetical protein